MIPTIETICEDLKAGKITVQQAIAWLNEHASGAANELRDMYAGMAMQGFCANPAVFAANAGNGWALVNSTTAQLASYTFHIADQMLGARREKMER